MKQVFGELHFISQMENFLGVFLLIYSEIFFSLLQLRF